MREISLREYERTEEPIHLTADERDAIAAAIPSIAISPAPGESGQYHLTPSSVIGVVELGDLAVRIEPKLPIDRVLFLVSYALDPKNWQQVGFDLQEHKSLVEAVIPAFVTHSRHALRRGVLQGYQVCEDSSSTVRGQIRFGDQIKKRFGLFPPVEVRFDEFTEDITENRLIKSAAALLLKRSIRSSRLRTDLRRLESTLQNVSVRPYSKAQVPDVKFNRLNERYRAAIGLAKLILRFCSFDIDRGGTRATSFLVDMNQVFEDFVVLALREELGLSRRSFPQNAKGRKLQLDEAGRINLEPDISWWKGHQCCFVGDVKYKRTDSGLGKHPDLYQLLAYTVASNLHEGMLIYAAGSAEARTHKVKFAEKTLHVLALNLSGSPSEVLKQIRDVGNEISRQSLLVTNFA